MPATSNIPFATAFAVAHAISLDDPSLPHAIDDYWEHHPRTNEHIEAGGDAYESSIQHSALQSLLTTAPSPDEQKRAELIANDPTLALLGELVDQRARLDTQIRQLTCLFREWSEPALPLTALAAILRASPGGVRISYTDEIREQVIEITGSKPVSSRDPERASWAPSSDTKSSDRYLLGTDLRGEPVTVPYGSPIAIIADPDKRETRSLTDLLAHQIVANEFGDLIGEDPWATQHYPGLAPWFADAKADPPHLAILVPITLGISQLYGPVDDTFQHGSTRIRLDEVLTTFTECEHISIARIVAAATAPAPKHSILVGEALKTVGQEWAAEIPVITGPQRGHDWRWILSIPGKPAIPFRPARTNTAWAKGFDTGLQALYGALTDRDVVARQVVTLLRQTVETAAHLPR
ncbi:hypothetical protein [Mycobacteroides abscessus]|uniref:hypothetical protein n=1 Tax=Mycobacteroides abscessus TaxID=36809 RepID=UPI0013000480|nr:hypothetical protein [Mycobacteroides abscessus]